jgi:hypothetical protein
MPSPPPREAILAFLLVARHVLQRAHVVEAIDELHQEHADVLAHREQHLAEALRLLLLARQVRDLAELRDAVDDVCDLAAELLGHVVDGELGVLDDVVQERRDDAAVVEPELGEDASDAGRVHEVRLAALARLAVVGVDAELERALDRGRVRVRVVALDLGDEIRERAAVDERGRVDRRMAQDRRRLRVERERIGARRIARVGAARRGRLAVGGRGGRVDGDRTGDRRSAHSSVSCPDSTASARSRWRSVECSCAT